MLVVYVPKVWSAPLGYFCFMAADVDYMQRALALAARARGATSPNPMVGCVVVRDGAVIGEGYHTRAGEAHAEVNAIRAAGGAAEGATVYVTLEPCAHQGRTPPCTELLVSTRPARVVVAMNDPNPKVAGRGITALRTAGIPVDVGVLEAEAMRLNEAYTIYITEGRPFTIAKCAMSLDGKIATRTGSSKWITGEAARAHAHAVRGEVDAILVGHRTLEMDDPSLTARGHSPAKQPVRIVLTSNGHVDLGRNIFSAAGGATWIVAPGQRRGPAEVRFGDATQRILHLDLPADDSGRVNLGVLAKELGRREIMTLLIEGGGETLAAAFAAGIVDKVLCYVAPKIVGGRDAVTPVGGEGVAMVDDAIQLEDMRAQPLGGDVLIEAYVKRRDVCLQAS